MPGAGQAIDTIRQLLRGRRAAFATARALLAESQAPHWFDQHQTSLIVRALSDERNMLQPVGTQQEFDDMLQVMSGSRKENLKQWMSDPSIRERLGALNLLRPWDGGSEGALPQLVVQPSTNFDGALEAIGHNGRHRMLGAMLSGQPTIVEVTSPLQSLFGRRGGFSKYAGDDWASEIPVEFSSHRTPFCKGGLASVRRANV